MLKKQLNHRHEATMNFPFISHKPILAIFLCFLGLVGCTLTLSKETTKNFPVKWNTGFKMPELLATSNIPLNSINELSQLIIAPWYAEVGVSKTKVGETVFSSCEDYFDNAEPFTRTIRDNEMSAYIEFKIMCEATRLLINANKSKESFLPSNVLNDDSPKLWPKEMALQISTEESKRSNQNTELRSWDEVTPIIKYESKSETKSVYFHEGGYQEVEILGRGDANNDGIEDIFIVVRDYVQGGDYFNLRLFVLSVNRQGNWILIKSI